MLFELDKDLKSTFLLSQIASQDGMPGFSFNRFILCFFEKDKAIDNLDGDEYAVSFDATPDAYGCYDTVILKFENGKVKDVIESDKYYDSTNSYLK